MRNESLACNWRRALDNAKIWLEWLRDLIKALMRVIRVVPGPQMLRTHEILSFSSWALASRSSLLNSSHFLEQSYWNSWLFMIWYPSNPVEPLAFQSFRTSSDGILRRVAVWESRWFSQSLCILSEDFCSLEQAWRVEKRYTPSRKTVHEQASEGVGTCRSEFKL